MVVSSPPRTGSVLAMCLVLFVLIIHRTDAVLETLAIDVPLDDGTTRTLLASKAFFGTPLAQGADNNVARRLTIGPRDNYLLCQNITTTETSTHWTGTTILVPRGVCTFEMKAYNAQLLGADNIIIYGTLKSRYSINATNQTAENNSIDDIVFPKEYEDYDCSFGNANVPSSSMDFDPLPYNAIHNDPLLSGTSQRNLCKSLSSDELSSCASKYCLLTGNYSDDGSTMDACCAWDLHIFLYADSAFTNQTEVTISAAYVTMRQGDWLLDTLMQSSGALNVTLYARNQPKYNFSSLAIWLLGVFVAALASYLSAGEYRWLIRRIRRRQQRGLRTTNTQCISNSDGLLQESPMVIEESLELNVWHALGFVVVASSGLLILFYFKIYDVVKVLYGLGCSQAMSQVIFLPLLKKIARIVRFKDKIVWRTGTQDFGDISILDICSYVMGFTIGISWIYVCLTSHDLDANYFYWIVQDVMGACMCIIFLAVIKLNSIRVASILLIVAFFYDIFFVFITPFLFGNSIMITVATSGGPPTADPLWCEKYPSDSNCQGGEPLPMLFTIPRLFDYMGGSSLLGLGDIVLPGLLLSFAARYDTAKYLMGIAAGGSGATNNSYSCPEQKYCWNCGLCSGGYFPPVVFAYAVGLGMANIAVYLMKMGQPALLYLVPCCLGTMVFMGWRRNELQGLWDGPRVVKSADAMLYGDASTSDTSGTHQVVPVDDNQEAPLTSAACAADDVGDNL